MEKTLLKKRKCSSILKSEVRVRLTKKISSDLDSFNFRISLKKMKRVTKKDHKPQKH